MLRIHFTSEDLARTTIAPGPDPLWETLLSLYRLRNSGGGMFFSAWRDQVRPDIPASAHLLSELAPPKGYSADFLTPTRHVTSIRDGVEAVRSTPRTRLRDDVAELARRHPGRPLRRWTRALADGEAGELTRVADAIDGYFAAALRPHWAHIRAQVDHDRVRRSRTLAAEGWESVFATLHPSARWSYPVLELDFPADHDVPLDGRGLLPQPAFFCWGTPTTLLDTGLPPRLVYPIEHQLGWASGGQDPARNAALPALLGRTRASVLEAVAEGECTTTELARRLRIPQPTASRQAAILREAGLITTRRLHQAVIHILTPLGVSLLDGVPLAPSP
ncbi:ArsR/SmtB family transcription factor [Sphaerisporangium corydalis]|uniref:ArsR/SmtB family transcription factor n=1 Tax=Sphaerisporangium corydalis TaxID=1441875 RepID=A0ABV9EK94_9ACTN|nr:winged helix-turn-helix domain-containing protein [Sphaerisporangium corydalis]